MNDEIILEARTSERGNLYIAEVFRQIPFVIQRFYVIANVPRGETRGMHAHKLLEQAVFPLAGSFELLTDDGTTKRTARLNSPSRGAFIRKRVWHSLRDFSDDAVALIVASDPYDESDYLRNYQQFLNYLTT